MSESIESFVARLLPQKESSGCELTRLEGGLGSINYRVTLAGKEPGQVKRMVMTVFFDPATWWKIDKEYFLRRITGRDPDVLLPQIIDSGEDCWGRQRIAFLLREFAEGHDLNGVLEGGMGKGFSDENWPVIARDLGFRIGALHAHPLSGFGLISGAESQFSQRLSWRDFFARELETMSGAFYSYPRAKQIGSCQVDHVVSLFPAIERLVGDHIASLETVTSPRLTHGDARFANFVVNCDEDGSWRIKALIDLEWAVAGDPEVDLACVENWLYSSTYQAQFYRVRPDLMAGYNVKRSVSPQYREKRLLYHTLRSLSYLCLVFALNPKAFIRANPHNVRYVEKNYQILQALARQGDLAALDILPIDEP
jgi:hypothetical protein